MESRTKKFKTVDEYLSALTPKTRGLFQEMRSTIRNAAPKAEELISYNIPAFKQQGMLVWYAAFKTHIGFYPRVSAIEAFKKELSLYKGAKGSVQFPMDKPLPLSLVSKIVKFRIKENSKRAVVKKVKTKTLK
jgi:uncharacterized protein YdhG (YjbR/CyaY superfamily)